LWGKDLRALEGEQIDCVTKKFSALALLWPVCLYLVFVERDNDQNIQQHQMVDGVSRKVLTDQLKSLESAGLLTRKQYEEIPPRVEYSLTEKSKGLCEVFQAIEKWSNLADK